MWHILCAHKFNFVFQDLLLFTILRILLYVNKRRVGHLRPNTAASLNIYCSSYAKKLFGGVKTKGRRWGGEEGKELSQEVVPEI